MTPSKAVIFFGDTSQASHGTRTILDEIVSEFSGFFDIRIISTGELTSVETTSKSFPGLSRMLVEFGPEPFRQARSVFVRLLGLALKVLEIHRISRRVSKLMEFEKPDFVFVFMDSVPVCQIARRVNFGGAKKVALFFAPSGHMKTLGVKRFPGIKNSWNPRDFSSWEYRVCLGGDCGGSGIGVPGGIPTKSRLRFRVQSLGSSLDMSNWLVIRPKMVHESGAEILTWLGVKGFRKNFEEYATSEAAPMARNKMGTWPRCNDASGKLGGSSKATIVLARGHAIRVWSSIFSVPERRVGFFSVVLSLTLRVVNFVNQEIIRICTAKKSNRGNLL
jgi:hypothetical protein